MFDSDLGTDEESVLRRRRTFLLSSASALAGAILWSMRRPRSVQANAANSTSAEVTIVEFSDSGERLKTVHVPKVVKCEDEWHKQLSPAVFAITRQADTELAYTGEYWNLHERGLYHCICCANALFTSDTKSSPELAGRASGARSRRKISEKRKMPASASKLQSHALSATRIWGTSSTMVRNLLACGTA